MKSMENLKNNKIIQFLFWLIVLTPITILTTEWRILQVLVLAVFFVFGIGFFFLKEFKKYIPLAAAFFIALSISIFGHSFFV